MLAFLRLLCGRDPNLAESQEGESSAFRERCKAVLSARLLDGFRSGIVLRIFEQVLCLESDLGEFVHLSGILPFYAGLGESLAAFRKGEVATGLVLCLVELVTRAVRCLDEQSGQRAAAAAGGEGVDLLPGAVRLTAAVLNCFNFGVHVKLRDVMQRLLGGMAAVHGPRLVEKMEQHLMAVHEDFHERRKSDLDGVSGA